jgi:tRNA-2-methylthio-N6-dimethylallyladenosine synthase
MNVYDSIKIESLLRPHGFMISESFEDADLVVLNTCHIREKAAEKVYAELGRIRLYKERKKACGGDMIIAVAGCVAQAEGEEIFARAPFVNIVVGPQSYQNLPELLEKVKRKEKWVIDLDFAEESKFDEIAGLEDRQGVVAYLAIQEGCDKFCHYCVVPYTRGSEYSRSVSEIYREAMRLVAGGAKEIQLLGQNVNAFHGESSDGKDWTLGKLIKHLANINGLERIRYTTSHPSDMLHQDLFEAHRDVPQLMPLLHLPIQSGSTRILQQMNRKHTREFYLEVIDKFRRYRSDMSFSSDFIVGYPTETDEDFADTLRIVQEVGFSQCYSFKYSPRPGTPAMLVEDQVPEAVKSSRLLELQELIHDYQLRFNKPFVGQRIKVLFDKEGRNPGQVMGRSEHMQSVFAAGDSRYLNQILEVDINKIEPHSLGGDIVC